MFEKLFVEHFLRQPCEPTAESLIYFYLSSIDADTVRAILPRLTKVSSIALQLDVTASPSTMQLAVPLVSAQAQATSSSKSLLVSVQQCFSQCPQNAINLDSPNDAAFNLVTFEGTRSQSLLELPENAREDIQGGCPSHPRTNSRHPSCC